MEIKDLKAYGKNPRKITDEDFALLGSSLKEFGDLSGIVLNRSSGELVGGNQRTNFFKLEPEKCKIILTEELDKPSPTGTVALGYVLYNGERFSLRVVDWNEDQEKRANILANKVGGVWDFDKLANAFDVDMLLSHGFKAFEIGFAGGAPKEPDADTLKESMTSYLDGSIRQVTFYFSVEEYETLLPRLDSIMEKQGLKSHTEVLNFILKQYEDTQS